jgi:hypothetical protein
MLAERTAEKAKKRRRFVEFPARKNRSGNGVTFSRGL